MILYCKKCKRYYHDLEATYLVNRRTDISTFYCKKCKSELEETVSYYSKFSEEKIIKLLNEYERKLEK